VGQLAHRQPEEGACAERRELDLGPVREAVVLAEGVAVIQAGHERAVALGAQVRRERIGQVPRRAEADDEVDVAGGKLTPAQRRGGDLEIAGVPAHERPQARVRIAPGHLPPAER
jgi:hypothetical protein